MRVNLILKFVNLTDQVQYELFECYADMRIFHAFLYVRFTRVLICASNARYDMRILYAF